MMKGIKLPDKDFESTIIEAINDDQPNTFRELVECIPEGLNKYFFESLIKPTNKLPFDSPNLLLLCCLHGAVNCLAEVLAEKNVEFSVTDKRGFNCFHYAAAGGSVAVLKKLKEIFTSQNIEIPSTPNVKSPLFYSSMHGRLGAVQYFLSQEAFAHLTEDEIINTILIAIEYGHLDVLKLFLESQYRELLLKLPLICFASSFGQDHIISYLIQEGADVNATWMNKTALSHAVKSGCISAVKLLVENDPNISLNAYLAEAAIGSHNDILKHLLSIIDVNVFDSEYATPLSKAIEENQTNSINFLKECGAEINPKLHKRVSSDNVPKEKFELFLELQKVKKMVKNHPLVVAAEKNIEVFEQLISQADASEIVNNDIKLIERKLIICKEFFKAVENDGRFCDSVFPGKPPAFKQSSCDVSFPKFKSSCDVSFPKFKSSCDDDCNENIGTTPLTQCEAENINIEELYQKYIILSQSRRFSSFPDDINYFNPLYGVLFEINQIVIKSESDELYKIIRDYNLSFNLEILTEQVQLYHNDKVEKK